MIEPPEIGSVWWTNRGGSSDDIIIWMVLDDKPLGDDHISCQWWIPSESSSGLNCIRRSSFGPPHLRRLSDEGYTNGK